MKTKTKYKKKCIIARSICWNNLNWIMNACRAFDCPYVSEFVCVYPNARTSLVSLRVKESYAQMNIFSPQIISFAQFISAYKRRETRRKTGAQNGRKQKATVFSQALYCHCCFHSIRMQTKNRAVLFIYIYPLSCCTASRSLKLASEWESIQAIFSIVYMWMRARVCICFSYIHSIPLACQSFSLFLSSFLRLKLTYERMFACVHIYEYFLFQNVVEFICMTFSLPLVSTISVRPSCFNEFHCRFVPYYACA